QEKRKQSTVDLQAHGIFRTAEIVLELQKLLDPFEKQLDLPALLVEYSELLGATFEVIGDQDKVRLDAIAIDPNTAHILSEIAVGAFGVEDFLVEAIHLVRLDTGFSTGLCQLSNTRHIGIFLQPSDKDRTRLIDAVPPVVIAVALVEHVGNTRLDRHLQRIAQVIEVGGCDVHVRWGQLLAIQPDMDLEPLGDPRLGGESPVVEPGASQGNAGRVDQADHRRYRASLLAPDLGQQ